MADSYVVQGAQLKCSCGDQTSNLQVTDHHVSICGKPQANLDDFKPNIHIAPFGLCQSMVNPTVAAATAANKGRLKKMPCVPNTVTPWISSKTDVLIDEQPVLLTSSILYCRWNGTITISNDGQD